MLGLTKKEVAFFDMFVDASESICRAADLLDELMNNYVNVAEKVKAIEDIEHECDQHVHDMMEQLNKSFITPIDREDISMIAKEMDNITDSIESTAHRFVMLNVDVLKEDSKKLSKLIVESTRELKGVMIELKNMKNSKTLQKKIIEVNRIEDEGDTIFRNAVTELFRREKNALEVIKWKEIYEFLENTLDVCEDVANIVEGVVTKHA